MMQRSHPYDEWFEPNNKDTFTLRYPSLLAQLVYSVFCWAYPQSHPKFDSDFRETILQTCSRWVGGIRLQPELHKKWDLQKLEVPISIICIVYQYPCT